MKRKIYSTYCNIEVTEAVIPYIVRKSAQQLETLLFSCGEHTGPTHTVTRDQFWHYQLTEKFDDDQHSNNLLNKLTFRNTS